MLKLLGLDETALWRYIAIALGLGWTGHTMVTINIYILAILLVTLTIGGAVLYIRFSQMDEFQMFGGMLGSIGQMIEHAQQQDQLQMQMQMQQPLHTRHSKISGTAEIHGQCVEIVVGQGTSSQSIWLPYSAESAKFLRGSTVTRHTSIGLSTVKPFPGVPCLVTPSQMDCSKVELKTAQGRQFEWSDHTEINWYELG